MAEVTRSTRSLRETLAAFDARVSPLEQVAPPRGANVGVNGVAVDATRRAAWTTPTWVEAKPELVDWNTTDVYNWLRALEVPGAEYAAEQLRRNGIDGSCLRTIELTDDNLRFAFGIDNVVERAGVLQALHGLVKYGPILYADMVKASIPAGSRRRLPHAATASPSLLDAYQGVPGNDRWWRWLATATADGWDGAHPPQDATAPAVESDRQGKTTRSWEVTLAAIQPLALSEPVPPPKLATSDKLDRLLAEMEAAEQRPPPAILQAFDAAPATTERLGHEPRPVASTGPTPVVPARREDVSEWGRLEEVAGLEQMQATKAAAAATACLGEDHNTPTGALAQTAMRLEPVPEPEPATVGPGPEASKRTPDTPTPAVGDKTVSPPDSNRVTSQPDPAPPSLEVKPSPAISQQSESDAGDPNPERTDEIEPQAKAGLSTQNHGTKPPDPILDSDSDDSDSDSDDSSDYSSTDSDDDDENSENRQACRRIFDHIDADGSGLVELDEVLDSWQQCTTMGLNPNAPSEARKVKKIVQQMDSDGSGALDFDEFWAWWREHLGERMALFGGLSQSLQKKHAAAVAKAAELERLKALTSLDRADLTRFSSKDGELAGDSSSDPLRSAFDLMDVDGGGTLDRNEVRQLCKNLGRELTDADVDGLIEKMDSDGSGTIEFAEFAAYFSVPVEEASAKQEGRPRERTDWSAKIAEEEKVAKESEPEPELEPLPVAAPSPRRQLRRRGGRGGGMGSGMRASKNLDID